MTAAAAPRRELPEGSCDAHIHVIGDPGHYPLDVRRSYTPAVATLAAYRKAMQRVGIGRAVFVQPSVYGTDNRCLLDALREGGADFRAVVVPRADVAAAELDAMHALGVRGVRLNLVNPAVLGLEAAIAICARMADRGWHLQLHAATGGDRDELLERLARGHSFPIVVDHFGQPTDLVAPPGLLDLVAAGKVWVKLSAPYRIGGKDGRGRGDLAPLVRSLLGANPERLVWGSDWPHVDLAGPVPELAELVDLLDEWIPDTAERQKVCVDNAARLYGFYPAR